MSSAPADGFEYPETEIARECHVTVEALRLFLRDKGFGFKHSGRSITGQGRPRLYGADLIKWLWIPSIAIRDMVKPPLTYDWARQLLKRAPVEWPTDLGRPAKYPPAAHLYVLGQLAKREKLPPFYKTRHITLAEAATQLSFALEALGHLVESGLLPPHLQHIAVLRLQRHNRPVDALLRADFESLRAWIPPIAEPGWYTLLEHAELTGWSWNKLKRHVDATTPECRPYRDTRSVIGDHYHEDDIGGVLGYAPAAPPAGDWRTETGIATFLDRSKGWVRNHRRPHERPQPRIAINGRVAPHWAPEVVERLRLVSEAERARQAQTTKPSA
jgi:hypothetical protein